MFVPSMDCERYQDLSELSWFSSVAQPWAAAESALPDTSMHSIGGKSSLAYEPLTYGIEDYTARMYSIPRSDSMEEVKTATALTDVVPMRRHEALQVSGFVKSEQDDSQVNLTDAVPLRRHEVLQVSDVVKFEQDDSQVKDEIELLKFDAELMLIDTPDMLINEIGDVDLIDYIVSDALPRVSHPPPLPTPPRSPSPPPRNPPTPPPASIPHNPPASQPPKQKKQMKETYLAIPRELTAGSSEDKKIPKMLILKTPQSSTINLQDISMSIADRIKTAGKRQRTKRYSERFEDEPEESEEEEEDVRPSKRVRRSSTTSSVSLSERYRELRDRNNEASRKSRMNRKEKEKDLMQTLGMAEKENTRLKGRADELEKLVHSLRKLLLQIVVNKGSAR